MIRELGRERLHAVKIEEIGESGKRKSAREERTSIQSEEDWQGNDRQRNFFRFRCQTFLCLFGVLCPPAQ
jgi:hypothetical protein